MRCDRCGAVAPALKTCRWRSGVGRPFALCDPCYAPLAAAVWIVPGPVPCFGACRACGSWVSVRELGEASGGGRRGAPSGICGGCGSGGGGSPGTAR
jgi:hypothetical protein